MIHPATTRADAIAALAEGASYTEVAERFDVSIDTIRTWRRRAGLPSRRPGPAPSSVKGERPEDELAFVGRWVRDGLIMRGVVA